ncbi:MAG: CPBP family intramembrane metalloprotease [Deltaproteobacteria bacterium]|nr:CPBP family intramembrane metalloprotease [Deltaproteobacteria bacterium]MBN2672582.1 CPBP family intramembrane metalloprotease [Deltaproteobacteria bacterium]
MNDLTLKDLDPRRFFLDTWRAIDNDVIRYRNTHGGKTDAATTAYVYIVAAVCLTLSDLHYFGGIDASESLIVFLDDPMSPTLHPLLWSLLGWLKPDRPIFLSGYYDLFHLGYWAVVKVVAYLFIPAIAIAVHPKLSFREIGLSTQGFLSHLMIYTVLFVPVLIAVIAVSFSAEFTEYYPFYEQSMRSSFDFWIWELFYIAQFFALEFFFRGFMLQPTRKSMGSAGIVAMMVPYVMIHYGKPITECFAAVIAGTILGTLALRTRSIWAGFLLHVSVALSMDIASNLQKGGWSWLKSLF